jgi:hypothetical protein
VKIHGNNPKKIQQGNREDKKGIMPISNPNEAKCEKAE